MTAPAVHVIHENPEWLVPLRATLEAEGVPWVDWFVHEGRVDLGAAPPEGVFYNRMSASSHTRDHRYAVELTAQLVAWLQHHGRRVVNGRRALQLEVSKFEQYLSLRAHGVRTPATVAASGRDEILSAARALGQAPFILKPNRGGKGLGVQLFNDVDALERALAGLRDVGEISLDGIALLQEYIRPAAGFITRMEFIGGRYYYAVEVDTSGGFELCPADACEVGEAFCPAPGEQPKQKFRLSEREPDAELLARLEEFLGANDAEIAAAEFVENEHGECFVYDINMNTNYNQQAERAAGGGRDAMREVARFLGRELARARAREVDGLPVGRTGT
ncbi:RimK family alpha-L-glutamate ligase [Thioalkalivibrio sp. XN279]|uniref:ATP-grasp domain-containing protein n=1 Tax=Thioalkalivibrio sp. XN279 TaxID=2714953 RepID=UPI0014077DAF|nr:alpha-L-glutamate ligase [Thioalkalivibrio sp. XN279]NHA13794.1 alpha-L-glutamate ligase [Thioalkalivibrio sp. XN279]